MKGGIIMRSTLFNKIKNVIQPIFWICLKTGSIVLLIVSVGLMIYSRGYFTSLLVSFVVQFSWVAIGAGIVMLLSRKWMYLVVNIASFSILYSFYAPYSTDEIQGEIENFSIAHFNVLKYNRNYNATIDAAIKSEANMISFQETDFEWCDVLIEKLREKYPYNITLPRKDCYGMALFSKLPFDVKAINEIAGYPYIQGEFEIKGEKMSFISIHTRAPIGRSNFQIRNLQISSLINNVNNIKGPKLVFGDFNSVPWDSAIMEFKEKTSLLDSRKNLEPTFPSYFPIAGIPIDFIFHSPEIKCVHFKTIKGTSSDHYGVLGGYTL